MKSVILCSRATINSALRTAPSAPTGTLSQKQNQHVLSPPGDRLNHPWLGWGIKTQLTAEKTETTDERAHAWMNTAANPAFCGDFLQIPFRKSELRLGGENLSYLSTVASCLHHTALSHLSTHTRRKHLTISPHPRSPPRKEKKTKKNKPKNIHQAWLDLNAQGRAVWLAHWFEFDLNTYYLRKNVCWRPKQLKFFFFNKGPKVDYERI